MMKNRITINSVPIYIYGILMFVYATKNSSSIELPEVIEFSIYVFTILLALFKILRTKYTWKEIVFCIVLGASGILSYVSTRQSMWLFGMLLVITMKNVNVDRMIRTFLRINIIILMVQGLFFLFALAGIGEMVTVFRNGTDRIRYAMQFTHPNGCSSAIFWTQMAWIYLNYKRINFKMIVSHMIIAVLTWLYTDTTTALLCATIVLLYLLGVKYISRKRIQSVLYHCVKYMPAVLFVAFASISYLYQSSATSDAVSFFLVLDIIFNSRIRLGAAAFSEFGPTFWGQYTNVKEAAYNAFYGVTPINFDNIYNFCLIQLGISAFVIIAVMSYKIVCQNIPERTLVIFALALYGCTEVSSINAFYAFPILLFATVIFKEPCKEMNGGILLNAK